MNHLRFLSAFLAPAVFAHARSGASEYQLLRQIPGDFFQTLASAGRTKQINLREGALALCYHGLVRDDPSALDLAAKVFEQEKGASS